VSAGRRILVTGAGGFVGSWLTPALLKAGAEVVGLYKPGLAPPAADCEPLAVDLRERSEVREALRRVRPDAVVHLAGIASPREAARDPVEALRVNYTAVDHLLHALAESAPAARLLLVSSGEVYGAGPADAAPFPETRPPRPANPYAASKLAGEQRGLLAFRHEGLDVVCARPFNHTGPGRPSEYAESSFARQLAEIERGEREPVVRVGNLEPLRDWSDVRDVVAAYQVLLERGQSGEVYNVCSGVLRPVQWVLDTLVALCRCEVRVEIDPERYQPVEAGRKASGGDPGRMRALGWTPSHSLEDTLAELLEAWRSRS